MIVSRPGWIRIILFLLAGWMALAQPGLPACWLEANACKVHVHFSPEQASRPHSHDYLLDLSTTDLAYSLPILLAPVSLLLAMIFLTMIYRQLAWPALYRLNRAYVLDPPPPRFASPC